MDTRAVREFLKRKNVWIVSFCVGGLVVLHSLRSKPPILIEEERVFVALEDISRDSSVNLNQFRWIPKSKLGKSALLGRPVNDQELHLLVGYRTQSSILKDEILMWDRLSAIERVKPKLAPKIKKNIEVFEEQ